jgi:hypothetical protein
MVFKDGNATRLFEAAKRTSLTELESDLDLNAETISTPRIQN